VAIMKNRYCTLEEMIFGDFEFVDSSEYAEVSPLFGTVISEKEPLKERKPGFFEKFVQSNSQECCCKS
jgi:hypothetical protein